MPSPPPSPPTPFSAPSWEPRFAIDGHTPSEEILQLALRLHVLSSSTGWAYREGAGVFAGYRVTPSRLAVAALGGGFPAPLTRDPDHILFEGLPLPQAAGRIRTWLEQEAAYPPQPWFDGGEAQGFQAYHVAYRQEIGPYGYMVVEPRWFEIHK